MLLGLFDTTCRAACDPQAMERMKVIHEKWHQAEIVSLRDKIR